jgi:hypothetical protein
MKSNGHFVPPMPFEFFVNEMRLMEDHLKVPRRKRMNRRNLRRMLFFLAQPFSRPRVRSAGRQPGLF